MTLALWLISWAMIENGSANPRNPSWVFVKELKNIFSVVSAIGFGLSAVIFVAVHFSSIEFSNHSEPQPPERSVEEIQQERETQKIRREQATAIAEEKKRMELETQNRQYEERKKQEELRKKSRSADAANQEALREF